MQGKADVPQDTGYKIHLPASLILQYHTYKALTAFVYYTFNSFLQTPPCLLGYIEQFGAKPLSNKILQGIAKNIGLPYIQRVIFKVFQHTVHQFFTVGFAAYNRAYFCVNIRFENMQGWCTCFETDAKLLSLTDNLRLFKMQLFD